MLCMSEKSYVCSKCKVNFPTQQALNEHMDLMEDTHDWEHDK
jgi:hypothetical protein